MTVWKVVAIVQIEEILAKKTTNKVLKKKKKKTSQREKQVKHFQFLNRKIVGKCTLKSWNFKCDHIPEVWNYIKLLSVRRDRH